MNVIKRVNGMRAWSRARRAELRPIALVPTMGCLHAGHLSLVRRARRHAGPRGVVVVSIYVNPTQFGPGEDFTRYPRPWKQDLALCREAGVDAVYAPSDAQMYPGRARGEHSTYVAEEQLSRDMEGRSRPGHFRGVTTVVAKLFLAVEPDVAVFGAKDFQQAAVVRRMVRDLNFGVRMVVAPTVRETDGLALSSRNRYLEGADRTRATVLWRALQSARRAVRSADSGRGVGVAALERRVASMVGKEGGARLDYVAFFDASTLRPVRRVRRGTRMALAVRVGGTRLIDNGAM